MRELLSSLRTNGAATLEWFGSWSKRARAEIVGGDGAVVVPDEIESVREGDALV